MRRKKAVELEQDDYGDDLISKLTKAKNICVFGMGKLFRDHCFKYYWHEALNVNCFSDNNSNLWGENINGIKCASPSELSKYEDLLVIIFMKHDKEVREQLENMGISNYIKADNLLGYFSKRG